MSTFNLTALIIIILTITGVALGRFPVFRMNRTTIAMVGATILVVMGAISFGDAAAAVDIETIILLFSIMVININFRLSGFFNLITTGILRLASTPRRLLALIIVASGLLSALFLNDTIVLVFTPIVLHVTGRLNRNPIPYLMALATAANVGSAATIIGNPQNILIGTASGIPFARFAALLTPVSLTGLVIIWLIIMLVYRKEFKKISFVSMPPESIRLLRPLLYKSVIAAVIMLAAFFIGFSMPVAALGSASLLLFTRRVKPERVFREIDWSLLVFFSGLFVVTGTLDEIGVSGILMRVMQINSGNQVIDLTVLSVILSNVISNVPAVLVLRPVAETFLNPETGWITMAMATTFAGNLTLLGSVANLIVAENARKSGVRLTFGEYLKAGVPITIFTIFAGVIILLI